MPHTSDIVLTVIADLIAQLATSSKGLSYLVWGDSAKLWYAQMTCSVAPNLAFLGMLHNPEAFVVHDL